MLDKRAFKEKAGVDLDLALGELGLTEAVYEQLLRLSVSSAESSMAVLNGALARADVLAIERAAHDLKGVFSNLRVRFLSDIASEIFDQIRSGIPPGMLESRITLLVSRFVVFKKILDGGG